MLAAPFRQERREEPAQYRRQCNAEQEQHSKVPARQDGRHRQCQHLRQAHVRSALRADRDHACDRSDHSQPSRAAQSWRKPLFDGVDIRGLVQERVERVQKQPEADRIAEEGQAGRGENPDRDAIGVALPCPPEPVDPQSRHSDEVRAVAVHPQREQRREEPIPPLSFLPTSSRSNSSAKHKCPSRTVEWPTQWSRRTRRILPSGRRPANCRSIDSTGRTR